MKYSNDEPDALLPEYRLRFLKFIRYKTHHHWWVLYLPSSRGILKFRHVEQSETSCSVLSIQNEQDFSCVEMTGKIHSDRTVPSCRTEWDILLCAVYSKRAGFLLRRNDRANSKWRGKLEMAGHYSIISDKSFHSGFTLSMRPILRLRRISFISFSRTIAHSADSQVSK